MKKIAIVAIVLGLFAVSSQQFNLSNPEGSDRVKSIEFANPEGSDRVKSVNQAF
ncbi:hypothetical protein [Halalkalibacter akibai]|uniref:Uncharacterized protein n=1 Tax=Halalkalibacter akibai (strain ATCC 43226 / DSM 21942 / CIP 109018 / JCM 9157 / 1139) TaxID=1236973 RepID=W4QWL2_HALA3|nr:hypothetical protein [Halalkalibacter akibai]GAE36510.1 hypothetical protein JCM9157_3703 [Halalkalibacter akibai JCM 9157]